MYFNLVSLPPKLNLCSRFNSNDEATNSREICIYIYRYIPPGISGEILLSLYIIFDVSSAIFRTAWDYVLNWEGRNERTSILAVTLDQLTRRRVYFPMLNQFDLTLAC